MHGSNIYFLVWQFLLVYNTKYKKKQHRFFKLTNSVTLAHLLVLHISITVQMLRVRCSCKCLLLVWLLLKERNRVDINENMESPFLIYLELTSQLDLVCHNCMGGNEINHSQSLRKHSYKQYFLQTVFFPQIQNSCLPNL